MNTGAKIAVKVTVAIKVVAGSCECCSGSWLGPELPRPDPAENVYC